ncbi:hypothetical protein ACH495_06765 [Micromonospora sp. NPDC018662]|uniref:hypothetical protein n=1 Tax=Micromonospora sp. NPDC018662 TaxID=3364238 RepID=UPI00378EE448
MLSITESDWSWAETGLDGTFRYLLATYSLSIRRSTTYRYGSLRSVTQRRADRAA